jgi:hypothetical protein
VRYTVNETARALLFVDGVRRVRGKLRKPGIAQLQWYGLVEGEPLREGRHALRLVGVDEAGNTSVPVSAGEVRIRYIGLAPAQVRVRQRARFRVAVDTDAVS